MKQTDTRILSNQAINIMSRLTRGEKPRDLDHAEDLLWEMAAEINNQALAIHQRDVLIEQLSDLVNTKQLTSLLNDRGFESAISKEQNRVDRGQSKGGVIVSIDLAGFKRINDDYNLQIGDLALKKFADVIRDFGFRETDIIGNPGGDEFVIVMKNVTDFEHVSSFIAQLVALIEEPITVRNEILRVSCSIGVSTYPNDGIEPTDLLRFADVAMYSAKNDPVNSFRFFTESMNARAKYRLSLENLVKRAYQQELFYNVYQPIVNAKTAKKTGN